MLPWYNLKHVKPKLNAAEQIVLIDAILESLDDGRRLVMARVNLQRDELYAVEAAGPRGDPRRRVHTVHQRLQIQMGPYTVLGQLHTRPGAAALGIECDVRDHHAVEAMVARVVDQWGRIDVLVANAGGGRGRPVDTKASTIDPALLDLVVGMNLFGTVYSCNAVAPFMKRQRSGKIVTVSSVAGLSSSADGGYAHYGAAKAAVAHYTRYLAQDLGPYGITANCIAPGVIATGRIMQTVLPGSSDSNRDRAELVALRRLGSVEDCAKAVEFLATDLSDYVTGAVIPIDGGLRRG